MTRFLPPTIVFLLVAAAYLLGALEPLDRALMDLRFDLLKRDASGEIVVVEIDPRSIRSLDQWPWPRRHHARLLDRLREAGAADIALDIDFSSRSVAAEDAAFEAALARAGGRVILPAFKQLSTDSRGRTALVHSAPIERFARHSRRALVNVRVDPDGRLRRYASQGAWKGEAITSMAAALAGGGRGPHPEFYVDYGIRPDTVKRLSYVDVLRGDFDPGAVAGKKVIVGATAVELGDTFAVPVHNILPGVVVQALAYETIVQSRALQHAVPVLALAIALVIALTLGPCFPGWSWRAGFAVALGTAAFAVAASVVVQGATSFSVDAAPWVLTPLMCYASGLWRMIDTQAWSILRHRLDALHRRAMMQSVVDDSFDGIAIVNQDGIVEVFNPAAERMLERSADDVVGTPIHSYIPWSPEIEELYGKAGAGDGEADAPVRNAVGPCEFPLVREDGAELTIELMVSSSRLSITATPLERRSVARKVYIYTFRDVTERKQTDAAQKKAMEQISSASRAKTEFLANMSHELRTPLNAVIGFSEVMKAQPFGPVGAPEYVDYIEDIFQSGQHLLAVINDILDMSKIEAGEMTLAEGLIDVGSFVGSCMRLIAERARKANVSISSEIADALPLLSADERMVKQMLLNLLSNAVKFTPEGGSVMLRADLEPAGGLVLSVADTGIGIAPEDMETVFQPFGQADSSLQRQYEGTGLGLPLVKAMAELHGGRLTLDSTPGVGTTATIRMPVARLQERKPSKHASAA